jgi:hypothetical protein
MRAEITEMAERNRRSKLYSLFSAWKFYIRERVLLKQYLKECNLQPDNILSTPGGNTVTHDTAAKLTPSLGGTKFSLGSAGAFAFDSTDDRASTAFITSLQKNYSSVPMNNGITMGTR